MSSRFKRCQYIAGPVTGSDRCKCGGRLCAPDLPYCLDHAIRCFSFYEPPPGFMAAHGIVAHGPHRSEGAGRHRVVWRVE